VLFIIDAELSNQLLELEKIKESSKKKLLLVINKINLNTEIKKEFKMLCLSQQRMTKGLKR